MGFSSIAWTTYTFNPWRGCTKVSPLCEHCYAENERSVLSHKIRWGPRGTRAVPTQQTFRKPHRWNRLAKGRHARPRVFTASLADVFEDWSGVMVNSHRQVVVHEDTGENITMGGVREELFEMVDRSPNLDWLMLTKRPQNIRRLWASGPDGSHCPHRSNVWLGTSPGTQQTAEQTIPKLLEMRDLSPVLFLSVEPLLEPVDLSPWLKPGALDWVIVGGESGKQARFCDPAWVDTIIDQCRAASVPVFVKQLGKNTGLARMGRKGGDVATWPKQLQVRELPDRAISRQR